jgi:hypothetical protein
LGGGRWFKFWLFQLKFIAETKNQYVERIEEAEKDIENGNYTTQEDLLKEIEKW